MTNIYGQDQVELINATRTVEKDEIKGVAIEDVPDGATKGQVDKVQVIAVVNLNYGSIFVKVEKKHLAGDNKVHGLFCFN